MRRILRLAATLTLVTAVATGGALTMASAAQAGDATVATVKTDLTKRIDMRLDALKRHDTTVVAAKNLTSAHEGTLRDLITKDTTGLNALKTKVAGETTIAALKTDAISMVDDYRIYLLVGPQVRLTIAGDAEQAAIVALQSAHDKLAGLVAKAKTAGKDTTVADQDLLDLQAALGKATSDENGQVAALLAIQPGPDAAGIRAKVTTVRAAAGAGRADLRTATAKAKAVRDILKAF
jgi:hypothetical protein